MTSAPLITDIPEETGERRRSVRIRWPGRRREAAPEQAPVTPTVDDVVQAIMREGAAAEGGCDEARARLVIQAYRDALVVLRGSSSVYHVTRDQMATVHAVMDVITPDDQIAAPTGSAHEALNMLLLGPGEFSLVHTKTGGRNEWCAVKLQVL